MSRRNGPVTNDWDDPTRTDYRDTDEIVGQRITPYPVIGGDVETAPSIHLPDEEKTLPG